MKHGQQTEQKSLRRLSRAAHEVDPEPDKAESAVGTSHSASDSEQNDPPSSLASDAETVWAYASYGAVGKDFHDQEDHWVGV